MGQIVRRREYSEPDSQRKINADILMEIYSARDIISIVHEPDGVVVVYYRK